MTYTTHGHHIPGTVKDDLHPLSVARCGGVSCCAECKQQAVDFLPDDSIARASLLNDLDALVVKDSENYEHPSGLPIVWKRPIIRNEEFMEFVDTPEGRDDIMGWLHLNRIESAFWPGNPDTKTHPRIEFLLEGHTRKLEIFPGQHLRKTFFDWSGNRMEKPAFEIVRKKEAEEYYEPSSQFAPAPWLFDDNNS
jgi:hypothetical protein